jgi:hypothetical protein
MLCKHRVADFTKWHRVFKSHTEAHRKAGLQLLHLLHDTTDPNHIVYLFRVHDVNKAKALTQAPDASQAAQDSGVIGVPELLFLND